MMVFGGDARRMRRNWLCTAPSCPA